MASPTSNRGEQAWHQRRKEWTNATEEVMLAKRNRALVINKEYDALCPKNEDLYLFYKGLVIQGSATKEPFPLRFTVRVMVQGWKTTGTWPEGMEAPPASD